MGNTASGETPATPVASRQTWSALTAWERECGGATLTPDASSSSLNRTEPSPAASGEIPAARTRSATSAGEAANGAQRSVPSS